MASCDSRILVWDLSRPGKARTQRIMEWLLPQRFELLVLAKCSSRTLPTIVEELEAAGYHVLLGAGFFQPCVAVASLKRAALEDWPGPEGYEHRWIPFRLHDTDVNPIQALAVHIPYAAEAGGGLEHKQRYWDAVLEWAREHLSRPSMILGVFNTGLAADSEGERFKLGSYMQELLDHGWIDCWRQANPGVKDFGWFSHTGNGFRLDHCFFSPVLAPRLKDASFEHQARLDGLAGSAPLLTMMSFSRRQTQQFSQPRE